MIAGVCGYITELEKKNLAWVQVQQMCSFSPDIRDVLYKSSQQDNELQLPLSAAP
jgi:hypothetical protein